MDDPSTESIRNVALVGHAGSGKTTLVEALLHRAGVIGRMGRVEDGSTVCDTEPESIKRGMSLTLALAPFDWDVDGRRYRVNVIDTPGHDDFAAALDAGLGVADLAVVVVSAVDGVEPGTLRAWARCEALGLPCLVFVTKEDKAGADFHAVLADLQETFGSRVRPLELPLGERQDFHGIADLLADTDAEYDAEGRPHPVPAPDDVAAEQHRLHDELVEEVVTGNDEQLERYLAGDPPGVDEFRATLAREVAERVVVPVLVGSATTGVGVRELAEFLCALGPAPRPTTVLVDGGPTPVPAEPGGEPLVHVFRTLADPFVGHVSLLKVLSGTIRADDRLVNTSTGADERLHGLFRVRGKEHLQARAVPAGDIAAISKLTGSPTRSLLTLPGRPVVMPPPQVPPPAFTVALRTVSASDEERLPEALRRLCAEDPALDVVQDGETSQVLLRGSGDVHVEVALERLARKFAVGTVTEPVRVAYRETIAAPVEAEGRVKKQSGGHGQFAVARLRLSPAERGSGFAFVDRVVGGAIPRNYLPAVERGVVEAMRAGGPLGHPVVDLRAECLDGKYHSVDSSDMAFRAAGGQALKDALEKAGTVVLEPIASLRVTVPEECTGDVLADLSGRRGRVLGTRVLADGSHEIEAMVPEAELGRYVVELRSLTGGRGQFRAERDHYDALPGRLAAGTARR